MKRAAGPTGTGLSIRFIACMVPCRVETRYLDWHAAHLEDKTQIEVLNPDVRQDKGLGQTTPLGKPFAAVSGNVKTDYSSLLPDYGTLRGYGIGVFQAVNSGTEDTRNTYQGTGISLPFMKTGTAASHIPILSACMTNFHI